MNTASRRRPPWPLLLLVAVGLTVLTARRVRRRRQALDDQRPTDLGFMRAIHAGFRRDAVRLESIAPQLERRDGAPAAAPKGWATFRQITLPIVLPGLITGSILVFIPMMGEYVIPQILGGGKVDLMGNIVRRAFLEQQNYPLGSAIDTDLDALSPNLPTRRVAEYLATYDLLCAPVCDEQSRLLGAVSIDDVLDHLLPPAWRRGPVRARGNGNGGNGRGGNGGRGSGEGGMGDGRGGDEPMERVG